MKITKKNKKLLLIVFFLLIISCIAYTIYYFCYLKPIKDTVVKISFEYIQFECGEGYMLPKEYRSQPDKMPQNEIDKLKESCKIKLDSLFSKNSEFGNRQYGIYNTIIEKLVSKEYAQVSSITKLNKIKKVVIKDNTASVTLKVDSQIKAQETSDAIITANTYTIGLIKENGTWKILTATYTLY